MKNYSNTNYYLKLWNYFLYGNRMLYISNNTFLRKIWMWLCNKYSLTKIYCGDDKNIFFTKVQLSSVTQSCPTLCDPMAYTVHGILQAKILERVAFPFSRRSSQSRDRTQVSPIAGGFLTSWATREAQLPTPNLTAICLQKLIPLLFQAFDLLFIITTPFLLALIFCWLISCLITLGH